MMIKDLVMCMGPRTPAIGSSGRLFPSVVSQNSDPFWRTGGTWTDINNVKLDDGNEARAETTETYIQNSKVLFAQGYGFNIPLNAIINGVTVTIKKRGPGITSTEDKLVSLAIGGNIVGDNKKKLPVWSPTIESTIYGGPTDLRGNVLTPQIINDSLFGLSFICTIKGGFYDPTISLVESIKIKVDYTYFI